MQYIRQANGSLSQYEESSEAMAALLALPQDRRPSFLDESEVAEELFTLQRDAAIQRVTSFANAIRTRIAKSQHYLQAARWPIQLASAQAVKAGKPSPFDLSTLAREARLRGRGETVEQLAEKVMANSMVFASVGAAVDGIESATLDAIAGYTGSDPGWFEQALAAAKATALTEFLDIFGAVYGADRARAMAAQFFGAGS